MPDTLLDIFSGSGVLHPYPVHKNSDEEITVQRIGGIFPAEGCSVPSLKFCFDNLAFQCPWPLSYFLWRHLFYLSLIS